MEEHEQGVQIDSQKLSKAFSKTIRQWVEEVLLTMRNTQADFLGLGSRITINYPKEWENTPATRPCCSHEDDGFRGVSLMVGGTLADLSPHDFVEVGFVKGCTVHILKCRKCGHESFAWFQPGEEGTE